MKKFLIIIFIFCGSLAGNAQLNNLAFEDRFKMDTLDNQTLYFGIRGMGYLKNNEYDDELVDGFTLFGYQVNPYLSYNISKNIRIDAGLFAQKEFGRQNYTTIDPFFTIKIQQNRWALIFGNLEGSLNHRYVEPLYNFERVITSRQEQGIQGLWMTDRIFLDLWINWEQMIFQGDPFQESFSTGVSFDYSLPVNNQLTLRLPLQLLAYHQGGEIDTSPNPLTTFINGALGGGLQYNLNPNQFIQQAELLSYFVFYTDQSNQKLQTFEDGFGLFINANVRTSLNFDLMLSYWRGEEYISVKGGDLYQSVSNAFNTFGQVDEVRQLLFIRFLHNWNISDQVILSSRLEPIFNLDNGNFKFTQGVYLHFRPRFFLLKSKK